MRFVLLHYHILKNAGTTVESILARNFGADFARLDSPEPNSHVSNASLLSFLDRHPRIRAVSSHQTHYPRPEAPDTVFFDLCFLRDPIDRVRSMYRDFRHRPASDDPVITLAQESGLGEFAAELVAHHPHLVNNTQVVLLANRGAYDHPPGKADLQSAIDTMLRMSFVGVVDLFNESCVAGQYFLRPVFPILDCAAAPANVSGANHGGRLRAACGERVYSQLRELSALDEELVKRARAEVRRRFQLAPDHAARLRALSQRVELLSEARPEQHSRMEQLLVRWGRDWLVRDHLHGA